MRGQFHLRVHVIISMVADVKFETTCDWSNNIWGQNKWLWVHMLIHVMGVVSTVKATTKQPSRDTASKTTLCCTVELSTGAVNILWGRVHTDNYMVELTHVTTSTYAGETVTHSRDIFCRHKKIICGWKIAWDYDLKYISWTFINWTRSPEALRPTSKLEALTSWLDLSFVLSSPILLTSKQMLTHKMVCVRI